MKLYLARHAEAVPLGGTIHRDADRTLSKRGEEDAALMGRILGQLDSTIDIVVTSPLARAVQTGELMGRAAANHPVFHVSEHLAPGFSPKALLRELLALSAGASLIAVGHQPDMSMFLSYLVADANHAAIVMEPGALAYVRLDEKNPHTESDLRWLLTPDTIKSILP